MKYSIHLVLIFCFGFFGCVDREFDAPPLDIDQTPNISADQVISINEMKQLRNQGEDFVQLNLDKYLRAIVVADDQSGNFYKSLVISDDSGEGITLLLDDVELWNIYFTGKEVYVHLLNLWLGDFNGLPQIGFEPFNDGGRVSMARVPAELIPDILFAGNNLGAPTPKKKSISDLSPADLNTLVTLTDIQFPGDNVNTTYADIVNNLAFNLDIEDCDGSSIIIRTSGFADFAGELTPSGRGELTGIIGVFGDDVQILIRDLDDVNFNQERCNAVLAENAISIGSLLDRWQAGAQVDITGSEVIKGTIVSSDETGNFFKSITVQDETGGIAILVDATDTYSEYPLGTVVFVKLGGLFISDFNGLPQLGYSASSSNVKRIPESQVASFIIPTIETVVLNPTEITLSDLSKDMLNTYVTLNEAQFISSDINQSYANADDRMALNHIIQDCNGNEIIIRTSGFADFADKNVPDGNGDITGLLQIFQEDYQLYLNFEEDVNFVDPRCP